MPPKRPAPLSDDLIPPKLQSQPAQHGQPAQVLERAEVMAATNNGMPQYTVKNTFIDVPSGLTPSNMRSGGFSKNSIMTAPADLSQPQGFVQRALIASTSTQPTQLSAIPSTPTPTAGARRVVSMTQSTPLCTPSPTAGPMVSFPGAPASGFAAAMNAAAAASGPAPACFSSMAPGPVMSPDQCHCGNVYVSDELFCRRCGAKRPEGRPAQAQVLSYSALPAGPLTYAMAPTSAKVYGTQSLSPRSAAMAPTPVLFGQSAQFQRPAAAAAAKATPAEQINEDDEEDDSDEDVPAHMRNPEDAPKPPPGAEHPSMGSGEHAAGNCKRCCFFPRGRCTNGYNCEFCHYEHEKRKRKNKKKKKKDGSAAVMQGQPILTGMPPGVSVYTADHVRFGAPPLTMDERFAYDATRAPPVQTFVTTPSAPAPVHYSSAPGSVVYTQPPPVHPPHAYTVAPQAPLHYMPQHPQPWETYGAAPVMYQPSQPTYSTPISPPQATTISTFGLPPSHPPTYQQYSTQPMQAPKQLATVPGVPVYNPPVPPPMMSPKLPVGIQQTLQTLSAE